MDKIDLNKYNIVAVKDVFTEETDKLIALNKMHSIEEFQQEINRVKALLFEAREKGEYDGYDWGYIETNISSKFDWFEIEFYTDNYVLY